MQSHFIVLVHPSCPIPASYSTLSYLCLGTAISRSYRLNCYNQFLFQIPYAAYSRVSLQNLIAPSLKLYGIAGSVVFTSSLTASRSEHHCRHSRYVKRAEPMHCTFDIVVLKKCMD